MPIINRIAEYQTDMTGWRRYLHENPELGLECHETAAFVVERLKEFGVDEIHTGSPHRALLPLSMVLVRDQPSVCVRIWMPYP